MIQKKDRMGFFQLDGNQFTCSRGKMWPPIDAVIYGSAEEARPEVTEKSYNSIRVWEQACGLKKMSPDKCPSCPYVEVNGELIVRPGGKGLKPQTIKATQVATNMARRGRR